MWWPTRSYLTSKWKPSYGTRNSKSFWSPMAAAQCRYSIPVLGRMCLSMQFPLLKSLFLHTHQVTVQYPCIPNWCSPLGHIVEQANSRAFVHLGIDYNTHFWKTVLPDREFLVDRYLLAFGLCRFGCIINHELYGSSVVISPLFFWYFQESLFISVFPWFCCSRS